MHKEIASRLGIPRPTITRWFHQLSVPSQNSHRITKFNLLNVGLKKGPRALPRVKREFPWKFNKNFFNEWSRGMAYILGFLCADGYVYKNPRGSCFVCFISTDREIIEKIRDLLGSNHKIGVKIRREQHPTWKDAYVLQIESKWLFNELNKFGIVQNKSLIIKFPQVPQEFLGDFIRGYFDGDGSVHLGRYWRSNRHNWHWEFSVRVTSGSKAFLIGLWESLKLYTQGGSLLKTKGGYDLSFSRHDGLRLFHLMYKTPCSCYLERKYRVFQQAFNVLHLGT